MPHAEREEYICIPVLFEALKPLRKTIMRLNSPLGMAILLGVALFTAIRICREPVKSLEPPRAAPGQVVARPFEDKKEISFDLGRGIKMGFVLIRPGSFMMGDEKGDADEKPVHKVTISKPFYLGKFEVTQEQWQAVMGSNPSHFRGAKNPVDRVSWEACQAFIKKLNAKFAPAQVTFGLPTEAEWEYACRAGSTSQYGFGDRESKLAEYGWFADNAGGATHPVGQKKPNAWGLYDMHGNVWEWCADWYDGDYYKKSPAIDPTGPTAVTSRVLRGGSWSDPSPYCRSSYRYCLPPWFCVYCYGVRVMCR
ncbi:MAG: formylglycine-generating enzyme family protein [Thermoguttaceae bacterium]